MKKNRTLIVYISVLFVVSIIIGIIYGINNNYNLTNYLSNLTNHNNLITTHILVILIFLFSTLSFLGIFIHSIYLAFEGISIGYLISVFFINYQINGLIYGILNVIINKAIFLICLVYLFIIGYRYFKKTINNLIGNNKDYLVSIFKPLLQKYGVIFIILIIYDIFIYFFGNMFLNYLSFML